MKMAFRYTAVWHSCGDLYTELPADFVIENPLNMKYKPLIAVAAIFGLASCGTSEPYRATDVTVVSPGVVETTFSTQYPNATNVVWAYYDPMVLTPVDWTLTGWSPLDANARLVHFNQDNQNYYVLYDRNGYRVASAYTLTDFTVIPTTVTDKLNVLYPAYKVSGLSRVTLSKDNQMAYEVELKKMYYTARVLIDDSGNIIDQRLIVNDHL
jgi:hypothetical protein